MSSSSSSHFTFDDDIIAPLYATTDPPLVANATTSITTDEEDFLTLDIRAPTFSWLLATTILSCIICGLTFQWVIEKGLFRKKLLEKANQYNVIVGVAGTAALLQTVLCFINILMGDNTSAALTVFITLNWIVMTHSSVMIVARKLSLTYPNAEQGWKRLLYINAGMMIISLMVSIVWTTSHNNDSNERWDKANSVLEPIQLILWGGIECILSALFISQMWKYHWIEVQRKGIAVMVIVAFCDLGLILLATLVNDLVSTCVKGLVYSLRIRLEVEVLSTMVNYIQEKRRCVVYMAKEQRRQQRRQKRGFASRWSGSNADLMDDDDDDVDDDVSVYTHDTNRTGKTFGMPLPNPTDFSSLFRSNFIADFAAATSDKLRIINSAGMASLNSLRDLKKSLNAMREHAMNRSTHSFRSKLSRAGSKTSLGRRKKRKSTLLERTEKTFRNSGSSNDPPLQEVKIVPTNVIPLNDDSGAFSNSELGPEGGGSNHQRRESIRDSNHTRDCRRRRRRSRRRHRPVPPCNCHELYKDDVHRCSFQEEPEESEKPTKPKRKLPFDQFGFSPGSDLGLDTSDDSEDGSSSDNDDDSGSNATGHQPAIVLMGRGSGHNSSSVNHHGSISSSAIHHGSISQLGGSTRRIVRGLPRARSNRDSFSARDLGGSGGFDDDDDEGQHSICGIPVNSFVISDGELSSDSSSEEEEEKQVEQEMAMQQEKPPAMPHPQEKAPPAPPRVSYAAKPLELASSSSTSTPNKPLQVNPEHQDMPPLARYSFVQNQTQSQRSHQSQQPSVTSRQSGDTTKHQEDIKRALKQLGSWIDQSNSAKSLPTSTTSTASPMRGADVEKGLPPLARYAATPTGSMQNMLRMSSTESQRSMQSGSVSLQQNNMFSHGSVDTTTQSQRSVISQQSTSATSPPRHHHIMSSHSIGSRSGQSQQQQSIPGQYGASSTSPRQQISAGSPPRQHVMSSSPQAGGVQASTQQSQRSITSQRNGSVVVIPDGSNEEDIKKAMEELDSWIGFRL